MWPFKKKEEKKRVNRVVVIIIEILLALLLLFSLIAIKYVITANDSDANKIKLENQVVENVSFIDFVIDYTNNEGKLSVSAINYTENPLKITKLKINLYATNNSLISTVEIPDEITLEKNQEHLVTASVGNIDKVASVEYILE